MQNKKILFLTLIFLLGCFGILGMAEEVSAGDNSYYQCGGDDGGYAECSGVDVQDCHTDCDDPWEYPEVECHFWTPSNCYCFCTNDTCADSYCKSIGKASGFCASMILKCCPSSCCDGSYKLTNLGKSGSYSCDTNSSCKSSSRQYCPNGCDMTTGECKAAPATHKECSSGSCVDVAGAGTDKCSRNSECKYKKCVDNKCKSVNVPGSSPIADECTRNSDCEEEEEEIIPACGPADGNCPAGCTNPPDPDCVASNGGDGGTGGGGTGGGIGGGPGVSGGTGGGPVSFDNPLTTASFEALISGIIKWILGIVVSLAILFLIIGGLMYITSAGNEEQATKAKKVILYALLGLGIIVLSYSIITELKDILGVK